MTMAWLGTVAVKTGGTVRSCVDVKERTYRICRKAGHGVCVRDMRCQDFWPESLEGWCCHPTIWEDRERKY